MEKIKVNQVVVVEGKYDAIKLDSIIDGLIIPVNGFSVYTDEDKKQLLKNLGRQNGIILATDSDTAGFKIRNFVQNICNDSEIINVYIPPVMGKESRKNNPSKEGLLGVEGINAEVLKKCFIDAGIGAINHDLQKKSHITYGDLYTLGLSGTENSSKNREKLCKALQIPTKLSKKAFLEVLNRMTNIDFIKETLNEKAAIFWDFHGTLTLPDNQWVDGAIMLCHEYFPEMHIKDEEIIKNLGGKCLPWWTYPDRDTRHLIENDGWWESCREEFIKMYIASGLSADQAEKIAPLIRKYVVDSKNHRLHENVAELLDTLKQRGYKNYILSNNFPELPPLIEQLGLSQYFEGCVVSALIGFDKPRKEIFEYAKTIAKDCKKCIMIGDNPIDDIRGAKENGFETILVNNRHPDYDGKDADYVCKNLIQVLDVLK